MRPLMPFIYFMPLAIFISCKEKQQEVGESLRPVRYHVVATGSAQNIRTFTGTAKVGSDIQLSFRTAGIIVEKNIAQGQSVNKGQLLGRLDNVETRLSYEQAVASLNGAKSDLNTAKSELDRVKSLYEKGSASLSDYENAKNAHQNALSQFESAERNKSIQQTQLGYGYIYAPTDGVIASSEGDVNERVAAGHHFATLNVSDGRMKVQVNLPENVINKVELNMEAQVNFPTIEGESFTGEVMEISPVFEENATTYPVQVEIIEPTDNIKPGMAARVTFNFTTSDRSNDDAIIIPIKAVGEDETGNFVFVIESEDGQTGLVLRQSVEVAEVTADGFKLVSGLEEGQLIATAGLQTLLDGQKVRLLQ